MLLTTSSLVRPSLTRLRVGLVNLEENVVLSTPKTTMPSKKSCRPSTKE
jgi:hypothetical protein